MTQQITKTITTTTTHYSTGIRTKIKQFIRKLTCFRAKRNKMMDEKTKQTYTILSKERIIYKCTKPHNARIENVCRNIEKKQQNMNKKDTIADQHYYNSVSQLHRLFCFSLSPCRSSSRSLTLSLLTTRIKGNIFYFFGYLFISSGMRWLCASVCFFALGQKFGFFTIL